MSNLRSKYKATNTDALKNKMKEEDDFINSYYSGRAGYHDIDEGKNKFRLYPNHSPKETFSVMKIVHWVTITNDEGEKKRKPIYNSKVHGGTEHDIFDSYVKAAKKFLTESEDDNMTAKMKKMTDWKDGILPSTSWMAYADKIESGEAEFGLLEIGKSVRDSLNKIANFEEDDEPIAVDPFTDVDDGIPVIVVYDKKAKPKDKYNVTVGNKPKALPLTDKQLESFDKATPLLEMFRDCYDEDDFDLAVEGLRNFDEESKIDMWDTDEWTEILEKIAAQYGEDAEKPAKKIKPKEKSKEEEAEESSKEDGDQFDEMDRGDLKRFVVREELDMKVFKSDSDDDIRDKIREAMPSCPLS